MREKGCIVPEIIKRDGRSPEHLPRNEESRSFTRIPAALSRPRDESAERHRGSSGERVVSFGVAHSRREKCPGGFDTATTAGGWERGGSGGETICNSRARATRGGGGGEDQLTKNDRR